ncbi:MAG: transcriptional regulator NrdR [Clostridia bacterium]|nr:transcriptional regulator NrdR [Clostridia bacterium]MDY3785698.1 transcriptional regulator NrdR [Eubacteriales bacterium]
MKCPSCGHPDTKVIDTRVVSDGCNIRRKRECLACQRRFITFEAVDTAQIVVIKRDGSRELFDRDKLRNGLIKACFKRPINVDELVNAIETHLVDSLILEISSKDIGEMVLEELKKMDEVSYIRFVSVFREFKDMESFLEVLNSLRDAEPADRELSAALNENARSEKK